MAKETLLANNELCQKEFGLSTYNPAESNNFAEVYAQMWLPEHSLELVNSLQEQKAITLIGEVGSGKSALLYGARTIMRAQGIPYTYVNGHFKDTPAEEVINVINDTEDKGMTLVYDSADYLVGGAKKVRALPLRIHIPRNIAIMERLIAYRQNGGTLLMTSHHEDWIKDVSHPDLAPSWNELKAHTQEQHVEIQFPEQEQRTTLLQKMGLETSVAEYIAQLPNNPDFINHIANRCGDKKYIEWAEHCLTRYPTLKLLVKDNFKDNEPVLQAINESFVEGQDSKLGWDSILDFMYSKTFVLAFFSRL